jgi:hypothetical protein
MYVAKEIHATLTPESQWLHRRSLVHRRLVVVVQRFCLLYQPWGAKPAAVRLRTSGEMLRHLELACYNKTEPPYGRPPPDLPDRHSTAKRNHACLLTTMGVSRTSLGSFRSICPQKQQNEGQRSERLRRSPFELPDRLFVAQGYSTNRCPRNPKPCNP